MFKVVIAGGRDFNDYEMLKSYCDELISNTAGRDKIDDDICIVSGKANGADTLGERYANERGYLIEEHPAQWNDLTVPNCKVKHNKYGKPYNALAGHNRNHDMVDVADLVIAFWDGKSAGTKDTVEYSKLTNVSLAIIHY